MQRVSGPQGKGMVLFCTLTSGGGFWLLRTVHWDTLLPKTRSGWHQI